MNKNQEISKIKKQIEKIIKPTKCLLCDSVITSCCNSHSVPKMILKNIAENGVILQSQSCIELKIFENEKGIKNSGTFFYICNSCDNIYFKDYENEEVFFKPLTDKILAEIALKSVLQDLYKKHFHLEVCKKQREKDISIMKAITLEQNINAISLDIQEDLDHVNLYKKIIDTDDNNTCQFDLLCNYVLPYRTQIAVQAVITPVADRDGKIINDLYDLSPENKMHSFYLCVFPLKEKTAIFAFYHHTDNVFEVLKEQLKKSSIDENLVYLNWMIFKYTENFFLSKSVEFIYKSNQKIKELYNELGGRGGVSPSEIPNFLLELK